MLLGRHRFKSEVRRLQARTRLNTRLETSEENLFLGSVPMYNLNMSPPGTLKVVYTALKLNGHTIEYLKVCYFNYNTDS